MNAELTDVVFRCKPTVSCIQLFRENRVYAQATIHGKFCFRKWITANYVKLLDVGQESEFDQASLRTHISSIKAKCGRRLVRSWSQTCSELEFGSEIARGSRSVTSFEPVCDQIA